MPGKANTKIDEAGVAAVERPDHADGRLVRLIEEPRPCLSCGHDLRGQSVRHEPHYGWYIVRCPECGFVAPLGTRAQNRWLWRSGAVVLAAAWWLTIVAVLAAAGGALGYASWTLSWSALRPAYAQQYAVDSVLAQQKNQFDAIKRFQRQIETLEAQVLLGQLAEDQGRSRIDQITSQIAAVTIMPMPGRLPARAHLAHPEVGLIASLRYLPWGQVWWSLVVAVPTAFFIALLAPGVTGRRLAAFAVFTFAVGWVALKVVEISSSSVQQTHLTASQVYLMFSGQLQRPSQMPIAPYGHIVEVLAGPMLVICCLIFAGCLRVSRVVSRPIVAIFTPRWIRSQLSELWTADGLEPPGVRGAGGR